jgi:hypothetical protein
VLQLRGASDGKGFPAIQTSSNPFPPDGDWTFSIEYRYATIGNYGTEFQVDDTNGNAIFITHADNSGQFVDFAGGERWRTTGTEWHSMSLGRVGSDYNLYVDGKQVANAVSSATAASIKIGGGMEANPWDWSGIDVRLISIDRGLQPASATSVEVASTPQTPAAPPAITPAPATQPGTTYIPVYVPTYIPVYTPVYTPPMYEEEEDFFYSETDTYTEEDEEW